MKKVVLSCLWLLMVGIYAYAIPAKPSLLTLTLPDGTPLSVCLYGDESFHYYTTPDKYLLLRGEDGYFYYATVKEGELVTSAFQAKEMDKRTDTEKHFLQSLDREELLAGLSRQSAKSMKRMAPRRAMQKATYPTTGEQKALVILVEYTDKKFTIENPAEAFTRLLNEEGYNENGATGSARDYFIENSAGQFIPEFDVYGPVTLAHEMEYYGGNNRQGSDYRPEEMVIEACRLLDDVIDFREYDRDSDKKIDNVYIFYAGYGEASSGIKETVWPHSWDISDATEEKIILDGVRLDHYACSNELTARNAEITGIGTFCHEFSHVLGLPDLYATDYSMAFTPGSWSLMDQGSYNNDEKTPPYLSVYERYALGWLEPIEIGEGAEHTLDTISKNIGYIIKTGKETEYFLLENRQRALWDKYIPGHGMLIWHIDYTDYAWEYNIVNNSANHQCVDIEEADGKATEATRKGDPFPGTANVTSFTDETTPNMQMWGGTYLNKPITDIEEEEGLIRFKISGGKPIVYEVYALPATDITETSFVANWQPNDKAVSYVIDVYKKEYGDPDSVVVNFASGVKNMPPGWHTNSTRAYGAEGYFGEASPSLFFSADGEFLESPVMNEDIRGLRFWYRGLDTKENNYLVLEGYVNREWISLDTLSSVPDVAGGKLAEWKEKTENAFPKGVKSIRIVNKRPDAGSVVIDDVVLYYGGEVSLAFLNGYKERNVGDTLSCVIKGLEKGVDYYYVVRAFYGREYSGVSNEITVPAVLKNSHIEQLESGKESITVYTQGKEIIINSEKAEVLPVSVISIQGAVLLQDQVMFGTNRYLLNGKGIYIVHVGGKAYKVIL